MPPKRGSSKKSSGPSRARDAKKPAPTQTSRTKLDAMALFRAEARSQDAQASKLVQTVDGFDNFVARLGVNNNNTLSAGTYEFNLVTRNRIKLEAAYRGSWVVGVIVDAVAEDMTRAGIDIQTSEADADIPAMQKKIADLAIWTSIASLVKWGRLYGGAIAVLDIEGQDLSTPLVLDSVGKDQFKGLVVYDRWQLNPSLNDVIESGPSMGLPACYQIVTPNNSSSPVAPTPTGAINVHHSRCIRFTGIDLPFFQAITEMMWGESVLERLWDRLISFDSASMSSANLIERANNRTVKIDGLREIIAAGGEAKAGLLSQMEMMREFQTNEGMTLLDKNDDHDVAVYTFSGLNDLLLQFGQQLAGACGIPLVRLFGQSPAGLSATGEADIRMYYDNIAAQQTAKLKNPFSTLLRVLWRSTTGKPAPTDLDFSFVPLWQMSASDKANIAKTNAETVIGAYEAGVTDRATTLEELRESSGDTGVFANISDEMITEAENEEPPMPDMDPNAPHPAVDPAKRPAPSFGAKADTGDARPAAVQTTDAKPSGWGKIRRWFSGR